MDMELHCHSRYSRGDHLPTEAIPSPQEIAREASRKGLDAVALTDHNTVAGWREMRAASKLAGILFIPGAEITTREGHLLALGIEELIPRGLPVEETIELVHGQGGIAIAPHPFDIKGDGISDHFRKADAAEVFNALNLDRWSNWVMRRKIDDHPAVAGSDAHTLAMVGRCVNTVEAADVDGALKAIRRGRVTFRARYNGVLEVRDWAHLRFSGSAADAAARVRQEYPPLQRWLSLRMLDKFVRHKGGFFTALAYWGILCSYGYGAGKAFQWL